MTATICIFEDSQYNKLHPISYTRPVYDLRCGITTLLEKIRRSYPRVKVVLHCRGYLSEVVKRDNPGISVNEIQADKCLFINGRILADEKFAAKIPLKGTDVVYMKDDTVVAARVSGGKLEALKQRLNDVFRVEDFQGLEKKDVEVEIIAYPWDLIKQNGKQIATDFRYLTANVKEKKIKGKVYPGAILLAKKNIFIGEGAKIKPGVVLDAEDGPIYIGRNAHIMPQATIIGPAFIGEGTAIKVGAKIYENTSIGEVCKVGGEVEGSIIHSYSNKQHDGFLGHSYLGMWVNLGADTNNSDLKNNYGDVKVYINDEPVDSGSMFVGLTMGDHSKSGINTMFNTGTVVGVSCNVYGADFPPKYIPSFSWGGAESFTTYDLERALEVAKRVMQRRKVEMTDIDERLFSKVFELTQEERKKRGMAA